MNVSYHSEIHVLDDNVIVACVLGERFHFEPVETVLGRDSD